MNPILLALYRVYQVCIMAPLMIVFTTITALSVMIGSMCGGGRWWGYYPAKIWSRLMAWISFVSVNVRGRENVNVKSSYIFVANHQGAYDIFAIYGWLGHNFKWMMKKSLEKIPLVGYACKKAGHIFVDKSSPSAIRDTMKAAEKQLAGGMSVVIFPEGTRSASGRLGRFRRGAFMLAEEFKLPVVPVTIDGSYDVLSTKRILPMPGRINITIHQAIEAGEEGHDPAKLMEESYQAIASSLPANRI